MNDKKQNYFEVLEEYRGETAVFSFPVMGPDKKIKTERMEGVLSKGSFYYSINGSRGTMILMPGGAGQLDISGKRYNLPDLL